MAERKPFLLRIDSAVLDAVQRWANDDLRSLNAQIEFVLRDALRRAGRLPRATGRELTTPPGLEAASRRCLRSLGMPASPAVTSSPRCQHLAYRPIRFADNCTVRPLLKWAGGKRQLLPALEPYYPSTFHRYLEPFVGSGAVFFHLASTGVLDGRPVTLSDVNADLIGCYRAVRDETEAVIDALQVLEREHRRRGDACYYEVRDDRFNPARATLMATATAVGKAAASATPPALAAMLIFLNRTGFNGLFRLNRGGEFNVPVGRYTRSAHLRSGAHPRRRRSSASPGRRDRTPRL